jgi:hypothetical protein
MLIGSLCPCVRACPSCGSLRLLETVVNTKLFQNALRIGGVSALRNVAHVKKNLYMFRDRNSGIRVSKWTCRVSYFWLAWQRNCEIAPSCCEFLQQLTDSPGDTWRAAREQWASNKRGNLAWDRKDLQISISNSKDTFWNLRYCRYKI